uniref:CSON010219 protein n=1 Tax=Culicoides sonorensis TaxID=179676 RepID=A0A336MDD9_CULSO
MTEIYEYAKSLYIEEFSIIELQMYKYLLATRILDYGMQLKCLLYIEHISKIILKNPSKFEPKFIERVYLFADRLKYYDPVMEKALDESYGAATVEDQKWLQDLRNVLNQYNLGALTYDQQPRDVSFLSSNTPLPSLTQNQVSPQIEAVPTMSQLDKEFSDINQQFSQLNLQYQQPLQQQQQSAETEVQQPYYPSETAQPDVASMQPRYSQGNVTDDVNAYQNVTQHQSTEYQSNDPSNQYGNYGESNVQQEQQQQQQQQQIDQNNYYGGAYNTGYQDQQQTPSMGYDSMQQQQQNSYDYYGQQSLGANDETPRPSITMPGTNSNKSAFYDSDTAGSGLGGGNSGQDQAKSGANQEQAKKGAANASKDGGKQGNANQGSGWFGGIFNKLSLKPKNQMKLPDDKNPSIVWDPNTKRWVNTEGGEDEQESFKPPPKMSDLMPSMQQSTNQPQQQVPTMQTPAMVPQAVPTVPMMDQNSIPSGFVAQPQPDKPGSDPAPTPRLQSNMFKMQRNRTLKKSYVDVFNPSGAPMSKPAEQVLAPAMPQTATPQTGFFVPGQPLTETDSQSNGAPQFYDPNQFSSYQQ